MWSGRRGVATVVERRVAGSSATGAVTSANVFTSATGPSGMHVEVEIPDKYADKLGEIEEVDPTFREQIEIEVLPQVLRLINEGHRQLDEQRSATVDARDAGDAADESDD